MDLYAAGFNAWRQLELSNFEDSPEEPDDIVAFQRVLSDELIEIQYASLSLTIVNTTAGLQHAGSINSCVESWFEQKLLSSTAAIAGNGVIAIYEGINSIRQYASPHPSTEAGESKIFSGVEDIIQLVAYETGFAALSRDGRVWTWGDERYAATLGREITMFSPAERPGIVEDLEGLPSGKINKIAAGGYTVLALTEGNDLYAWGGHPARQPIFETLSSSPVPVDVEDNDILDISVGEAHVICMASDGQVYVIGENTNGQLGLPVERTTVWKKVSLSLAKGTHVLGVKAGPRSSLIVTKNTHLA